MTLRRLLIQHLSESTATFGLLLTIFGCVVRAVRRTLHGGPLHHGGYGTGLASFV